MAQQTSTIIIGIDVCKDRLDRFEHDSGRVYSIGHRSRPGLTAREVAYSCRSSRPTATTKPWPKRPTPEDMTCIGSIRIV